MKKKKNKDFSIDRIEEETKKFVHEIDSFYEDEFIKDIEESIAYYCGEEEIGKVLDTIQEYIQIVDKYFENNLENYDIRDILNVRVFIFRIESYIFDLKIILKKCLKNKKKNYGKSKQKSL